MCDLNVQQWKLNYLSMLELHCIHISTSAYFRNKVIAKITCFSVSKVFSVFFRLLVQLL